MALAATRPYQYQSKNDPDTHLGTVTVTGTLTVNLGIGHNHFDVVATIRGQLADLAPGHHVAVYIPPTTPTGTKGQFTITVAKYNAGTWVLATVPVQVTFQAHVGNPV